MTPSRKTKKKTGAAGVGERVQDGLATASCLSRLVVFSLVCAWHGEFGGLFYNSEEAFKAKKA
jgi:hypothetical protein